MINEAVQFFLWILFIWISSFATYLFEYWHGLVLLKLFHLFLLSGKSFLSAEDQIRIVRVKSYIAHSVLTAWLGRSHLTSSSAFFSINKNTESQRGTVTAQGNTAHNYQS